MAGTRQPYSAFASGHHRRSGEPPRLAPAGAERLGGNPSLVQQGNSHYRGYAFLP
jgi:hypothetical protein